MKYLAAVLIVFGLFSLSGCGYAEARRAEAEARAAMMEAEKQRALAEKQALMARNLEDTEGEFAPALRGDEEEVARLREENKLLRSELEKANETIERLQSRTAVDEPES